MPRKKRTALERIAEARLTAIERITAGLASQPSLDSDALHAFRELCAAAEGSELRGREEHDLEGLAKKLDALIDAHNRLSDIVDGLRTSERAARRGERGLRMG